MKGESDTRRTRWVNQALGDSQTIHSQQELPHYPTCTTAYLSWSIAKNQLVEWQCKLKLLLISSGLVLNRIERKSCSSVKFYIVRVSECILYLILWTVSSFVLLICIADRTKLVNHWGLSISGKVATLASLWFVVVWLKSYFTLLFHFEISIWTTIENSIGWNFRSATFWLLFNHRLG